MEASGGVDTGGIAVLSEHKLQFVIQHERVELLKASPGQGKDEGIADPHQALEAVAVQATLLMFPEFIE